MDSTMLKAALLTLSLAFAVFLAGCPATMQPGTTADNALDATVVACRAVTAAIKSTDAAVVSNTLKGDAADTAIKGLSQAKAGCDVAVTTLQTAMPAASGASK